MPRARHQQNVLEIVNELVSRLKKCAEAGELALYRQRAPVTEYADNLARFLDGQGYLRQAERLRQGLQRFKATWPTWPTRFVGKPEFKATAESLVKLLKGIKGQILAPRVAEPPAAPSEAPIVSLTMEDITILETLAKERPMAVNQYDLETATRLPRKTIGPRLRCLENMKLIQRPVNTKRKGHSITPAGLSAIGKRDPKAP